MAAKLLQQEVISDLVSKVRGSNGEEIIIFLTKFFCFDPIYKDWEKNREKMSLKETKKAVKSLGGKAAKGSLDANLAVSVINSYVANQEGVVDVVTPQYALDLRLKAAQALVGIAEGRQQVDRLELSLELTNVFEELLESEKRAAMLRYSIDAGVKALM